MSTTAPPYVVLSLVGSICSLVRLAMDVIVATYNDNAENFNRLSHAGDANSARLPSHHRHAHGANHQQQDAANNNDSSETGAAGGKDLTSFVKDIFKVNNNVSGRTSNNGTPATSGSLGISNFFGSLHGAGQSEDGSGRSTPASRPFPADAYEPLLMKTDNNTSSNTDTIGAEEDPQRLERQEDTINTAAKNDLGVRQVSLIINFFLSIYFVLGFVLSTSTISRVIWKNDNDNDNNNNTSPLSPNKIAFNTIPLFLAATISLINVYMMFRDYEGLRFGIFQRLFYSSSSVLLCVAVLVAIMEKLSSSHLPSSSIIDRITLVLVIISVIVTVGEVVSYPFPYHLVSTTDRSDGNGTTLSGISNKGGSGGLSRRAIFVMLKPYFWPDATDSSAMTNRIRALTTWLCVVCAKICSLWAPIYVGRASTSLSQFKYWDCIRYSIIYAVIKFAGTSFNEAQGLVYLKVAQAAFVQLSEVTFHHVHSLSLDFHLRKKLGEVIRSMDRGISACDTLMKFLFLRLVPAMAEALLVVIIFSAYFKNFSLAVTVFFFVFVYVVVTIVMTLWRKKFRRAVAKSDNDWHDKCTDSLINFETVKYFTAEEYEKARFGEAVQKYQIGSVAVQASLSFLNIVQNLLLQSCLATGLILAAIGIKQRMDCCIDHGCEHGNSPCCAKLSRSDCPGMEVGDFVAVLSYTLQLFTPLNFLGTIYNGIVMAMVDLANLAELLAENPDVEDAPDAISLPSTNRVDSDSDIAVEFDNVFFHYPSQSENMGLKGLSFKLKRGTVTAIVGHTGAGKTTVSRLFFRFYDVNSGAVKLNGVDVRTVTQKTLRAAVGVVPQATALFNDTIESNIRYGRRDATREDLNHVAKAAQLETFIESLPLGWNTVVGDRGLKLAGGEKQRTAIARCLLKDPPFLILDEATSSLDTLTENSVQQALDNLSLKADRTCLVIAHRLGTIRNADNIIVLDNGKVLEEGSHDELLARDGRYAEMWNMQLHDNSEKKSNVSLAGGVT